MYLNQKLMIFFVLDEDSDESNDELCSSENDIEDYSDKSDSDIEYTTKKGYTRTKLKLEEKLNNSKLIKRKRTKNVELRRDTESNDTKRVASLRSTNAAIPNLLETKGLLKVVTTNHLSTNFDQIVAIYDYTIKSYN